MLRYQAAGIMPPSKVPTSFLCPITHEVMRDPVSTSDGQSYERRAIEHWLQHSNLSPLTGEQLHSKALTRNHALRNAIGEYDRAQPGLCLAEARGQSRPLATPTTRRHARSSAPARHTRQVPRR